MKDMMAFPAVTPLQDKNCHGKRCQLTSKEVEGVPNQDVRMAEVWQSGSLAPCWKRSQLKQVAQGFVKLSLNAFKGGDSWVLQAICSVFDHPHSKSI